jgi:hypothetical protein
MAKALLFVESRPTSAAQEAAYNDWYQNTHLGEVCQVKGFVGATRYRQADAQPMGASPTGTYLAIYEIDSDDLPGTYDGLIAAASTMNMSDTLSMDPMPTMTTWLPFGDRVEA